MDVIPRTKVQIQTKTNNVTGRPPIIFSDADWQNIEKLCSLMCTADEIAQFMEVSVDTLSRRILEQFGCTFAEYHKRNSVGAIISLRHIQWQSALNGTRPCRYGLESSI